jgi:hypothetical protein
MNLKAIQTVFKGYKFRSRLEARWFFPDGNGGYQGRFVDGSAGFVFITYTAYRGFLGTGSANEALTRARQARFEHGEKP